MGFAEKARQYLLKHVARFGIGCGICLIIMGVYMLIIANNADRFYVYHPGTGYILLGIAFVAMNLLDLEWKPLLMLICTVVALGFGMWILVFKSGDDTAKRPAVVQQEAVEEAAKSGEVPDEAASSTR